ncbi:MAG: polyprenyl synthetase family protein, partial [Candidatus Gracilibacteria bacterium]|nr:polyprenyl synthetase family protein [Candidatus Gracilibacteria bacterium]
EIKEATFYAVSGGKRIRSILALEFYLILTGKEINDLTLDDDIVKFCISLELIHAYSLVHDDLPAMDNDDFRRGELTVWKKFGEANGILIGDLLNTLSFEILSEISNEKIGLKLVKILSNSTGFFGMIGGQVEDLYYEENFDKINLDKLISLHNKKTGALITTSVLGGIILSKKEVNLELFDKYAKNIGLAFQIKDDILDVEGTIEETGKSVGGEEKGFVYFLGLEKSKKYLDDLIKESLEAIKNLNSDKLDFLTGYIGERKK